MCAGGIVTHTHTHTHTHTETHTHTQTHIFIHSPIFTYSCVLCSSHTTSCTSQDAAAVTPSMLSTLRQIMTGQHMTTSTTTTKSSSMTATQLVQRVAQELVLFCKKHVDVKEVLQGEMGGAGCAALQVWFCMWRVVFVCCGSVYVWECLCVVGVPFMVVVHTHTYTQPQHNAQHTQHQNPHTPNVLGKQITTANMAYTIHSSSSGTPCKHHCTQQHHHHHMAFPRRPQLVCTRACIHSTLH